MAEQIETEFQTWNPPAPVRVMIEADHAVNPQRAKAAGIVPDYLFVRDDGWVLGAPISLRVEARETWRGHWVAEWRRIDGGPYAGMWLRTWPPPIT